MHITKVIPFILMSLIVTTGIVLVIIATLTVVVIRAIVATTIILPVQFLKTHWQGFPSSTKPVQGSVFKIEH